MEYIKLPLKYITIIYYWLLRRINSGSLLFISTSILLVLYLEFFQDSFSTAIYSTSIKLITLINKLCQHFQELKLMFKVMYLNFISPEIILFFMSMFSCFFPFKFTGEHLFGHFFFMFHDKQINK